MRTIIILFIIFSPLHVFAQDVIVTPLTQHNKDFVFTVPPDTQDQGVFALKNVSDHTQEFTLSTASHVSTSAESEMQTTGHLFDTMRFFTTNPPEDVQGTFARNDFNIVALCANTDAMTDALLTWCHGKQKIGIKLEPDETARVRYTVTFPHDALTRPQSDLVVDSYDAEQDTTQETLRIPLVYRPDIKRVHELHLDEVRLHPSFSLWDIGAWIKNGFRAGYDVYARVSNHSINQQPSPLPYTVTLSLHPVRFYAARSISQSNELAPDQKAQHHFEKVSIPRFGSVIVETVLSYRDENGQEKTMAIEPVRLFFFPIRELMISVVLVSGGWYALRHLLRGRARRKERNQRTGKTLAHDDRQLQDNNNADTTPPSSIAPSTPSYTSLRQKQKKVVYNELYMEKQHKQETHVDLDWMREEQGFSDALRAQEKRINRRIFFGVVLVPIILGVGGYLLLRENPDAFQTPQQPSIRDLTREEQKPTEQTESSENTAPQEATQEQETQEEQVVIAPEQTTVQVLNGGAKTGAASALTTLLKEKKYKTLPAANARQNVEGVIVYYAQKYAGTAHAIAAALEETRTDISYEQSEDVPREKNADVVIVLGTPRPNQPKTTTDDSQKKEQITIQVLDGGSAKEMTQTIYDALHAAGYTMNDIRSASNKTTQTIIYHAADAHDTTQTVKEELQKFRTVDAVDVSDAVAKRYDADVVIVVGTK